MLNIYIMLIFVMFINLIFSSADFIKTNCTIDEYNKYLSFIEKVKSIELKEPTCSNKILADEVKITKLFNVFHKKIVVSLYNEKDPNLLPLASNICQGLSGAYKLNSLHYAFLIASSFACHNICFNYFKAANHYGVYYTFDKLSLYWSIASHTLEKGFSCTIDEFNKITKLNFDVNKVTYLLNPYGELLEELKVVNKVASLDVKEEKKILAFDVLIDNPNISIYSKEGDEILNENLRALINTYFINDISNINACFNNKKSASILLNFTINNKRFIFDDKNLSILENYCLETLFNINLNSYIKDISYLKIFGVFNLNLI